MAGVWGLAIFLAAVLAAWSSPPASAQERGALRIQIEREAAATEIYAQSFALVIGIDGYKAGWPKLSNAVRDAREVAAALERHGFKVTLKTELGSDDLRKALEDFVYGPGAAKDARLLIWFAGHGETINEEGYLVPADAPARSAGADFKRKALSLRRFGEYLREAEARHVLAIFDSCFAGTVFDTARSPAPAAITRATTLPVRQMISSGEAAQQVSDNGVFRRLFIDALDGKEPNADANKDGFITGTELGLFLADKVANLTGNAQTPRYGKLRALGYDRGDFVFKAGEVALPAPAQPSPGRFSPPPAAQNDASQAWVLVKDTTDRRALEAFRRQFGAANPFYDRLAEARIEELRGVRPSGVGAGAQEPLVTVERKQLFPPDKNQPSPLPTAEEQGGARQVATVTVDRDGTIGPPGALRAAPAPTNVPGMIVEGLPPKNDVAPAAPPPKKKLAARDDALPPQAASPPASANGYVAELPSESRKTRAEALKAIADLQQRYSSVLGSLTLDIRETKGGANGVYFRLVVGPPGSRGGVRQVCAKLEAQGFPVGNCFAIAN